MPGTSNVLYVATRRANRKLTKHEGYILKRLAPKTDVAGLCYLFALTPEALQREADRFGISLIEHVSWNTEPPAKPTGFDDVLHLRLSEGVMICPMCDDGIIIPWTKAATHGVCESCYYKALAETGRDYARNLRAFNEYTAMRCMVHDARKATKDGNARAKMLDYDKMAFGDCA